MTVRSRVVHAAITQLGRRGFEIRRNPSTRRQLIFDRHGVDLVLDVGAADGGFGRSLRSFGYEGHIVSFEPLAAAYGALASYIADDPLWCARNTALGVAPGKVSINVASNSTSSSILPMLDAHIAAAPSVRYVGQETIDVARLDDEAAELITPGRRPFLKIDTQGFEREVLAGGEAVVAAAIGLQLELSLVPLYEGGMLIDEAIGWAYDNGFQMVGLEQGYASPGGEILQIDGVFMRNSPGG